VADLKYEEPVGSDVLNGVMPTATVSSFLRVSTMVTRAAVTGVDVMVIFSLGPLAMVAHAASTPEIHTTDSENASHRFMDPPVARMLFTTTPGILA
jgi:sulfite exporter TauE/SafE